MRPTRLVLALAAALLLAPAASLAGKGPQPLDGPFLFVDKGTAFERLSSLAKIDQAFQEFCLDGKAVYVDTSSTLNHRIQIEYHSLGAIAKQSPSKVQGLFTTMDLTLTVFFGPIELFGVIFGPVTIDASSLCKLDGIVNKSGGEDRVTLVCKLGPDLSAFGEVPQDILDSIAFALNRRKGIKLDVKTGDLLINHNGEAAPSGFNSTLTCPTSSDNLQ